MLEHHLDTFAGVLVVEPKDPLTAEDFKSVAAEVDAYLADHDRLTGILINAATFPGWENFAGLTEHLRFVRDHHRRIARIAVVTDNELLKIPPQIAAHFVHPEIRVFPAAKLAVAMAWLRDVEG